jgi:hypothetical protein
VKEKAQIFELFEENSSSLITSVRISRLKGDAESARDIYIIWLMVSSMTRKRTSLDEDTMALCLGI